MPRRRRDPSAWMWAEAVDFIDRAGRMHREFFRLATSGEQVVWEPPADVFEDDHELVIVVALPGVANEDVEVATESGHLVVRAQRASVAGCRHHAVRQMEIPYGFFERRIALPAVPVEAASRELTHGCLVIRLRKARQK